MNHPTFIIVATDENRGIGKNGKLPWRLKKEIHFFKEITTKTESLDKVNAVIMGRKTWESIPEKFRPLPARENIVLTLQENYKAEGAIVVNSFKQAIDHLNENIEKVFIIGGAKIFEHALKELELTGLYITEIQSTFDCDTFLQELPKEYSNIEILGKNSEENVEYTYKLYTK